MATFYGTLDTTFEEKRTSVPAGLQGLAQGNSLRGSGGRRTFKLFQSRHLGFRVNPPFAFAAKGGGSHDPSTSPGAPSFPNFKSLLREAKLRPPHLKIPRTRSRYLTVLMSLFQPCGGGDFSVLSDSGPNPAAGIQAASHSSHPCVSLQSRQIISTG
jgi:hypothetical protein